METIGGGRILDPAPAKRRKANDALLESLAVKLGGSDTDVVEGILKGVRGASTVKTLSALASQSEAQIEQALGALLADGLAVRMEHAYFHIETIEAWRDQLTEITAGFHNKFSLKPGILKEELRSKAALPLKPREFDALLGIYRADHAFKISDNIVSLCGFERRYTAVQQKIRDHIEKTYLEAKYLPPPKSGIVTDAASSEVFDSMVKTTLVALDSENFIHMRHMDAAKEKIRAYIEKNSGLTLAEFRDMTNSSRKYCLLILEYFDDHGFTRRDGERRVLK